MHAVIIYLCTSDCDCPQVRQMAYSTNTGLGLTCIGFGYRVEFGRCGLFYYMFYIGCGKQPKDQISKNIIIFTCQALCNIRIFIFGSSLSLVASLVGFQPNGISTPHQWRCHVIVKAYAWTRGLCTEAAARTIFYEARLYCLVVLGKISFISNN